MKKIIEDLYKLDRYLLGEGYDKALEYIAEKLAPKDKLSGLNIIEIPSGTKLGGGWVVPDEWIIRDGYIKAPNGEKIIDWQKDKLAVSQGSEPVNLKMTKEEVEKKIYWSDIRPQATPYNYKLYGGGWGFNAPRNKVKQLMSCEGGICVPDMGVKMVVEGQKNEYKDLLEEGEYEVVIDSEYRPGMMKIGVHTIPGKTDREILLFAHLDHPWQANDNLSSVACLIDMAEKLRGKYEHTIKLIFCPETIGSIAYCETQDISKVDFVIALECLGNDHDLLFQKSFNVEDRLNRIVHLAIKNENESYRKGNYRQLIGSDENYFNDPKVGIQAIMLSRWDYGEKKYPEYHTSDDTPDIINEEKIQKVQNIILKTIEIWEEDFIPVRNFKGPLFRSKYGLHTPFKEINLTYDHIIYSIDGKISLAELCDMYGQGWDFTYPKFKKILEDGYITNSSTDTRQRKIKKAKGKE